MEAEAIDNLVAKAKGGDAQAFGFIYDEFSQKLFRFIRLKVQVQAECEDVLQDVFIKAWQGLAGFQLKDGNFNAWMYRIAVNAIHDYFRRKYRRPETVELNNTLQIQGGESPVEDLTRSQDAALLRKVLAALPSQYREVLELRFIQDFSIEETANILGKPNISVRVLQHLARNMKHEASG